MALPGDVNTITVTAEYQSLLGVAATGSVTFTPTATPLIDSSDQIFFEATPVTGTVTGSNGVLSVVLPCTDQFTPSGWTYQVQENISIGSSLSFSRSYYVALPHTLGASVNLITLAPLSTAPATYSYLPVSGGTIEGNLAVTGELTLGSTEITTPPGNNTEFLSGNGTWAIPAASMAAEALSSGESILPRFVSNESQVTLSTGLVNLTYWVAVTTGSSTGVTTYTSTTAASGNAYVGLGVYSVNLSNGNLTLEAVTSNVSGSNYTSAYAAYTNTWSASLNGGIFSRVAGNTYALGILAIGGTMPSLCGILGITALNSLPSPAGPMMTGQLYCASVTIASGSNGGEISTIASWMHPSPGVLDTTDPTTQNFNSSGQIIVPASGSTLAVVNYTGLTTSGFTGCTYVSGSATGTVSTGSTVLDEIPVGFGGNYVANGQLSTAAVIAP